MRQRFFVTVTAPSKALLSRPDECDFDWLPQIAASTRQKQYKVDGLLTLEQIGQLAEQGYQVLVKEESSKTARPPFVEFSEWSRGIEVALQPAGYLSVEGIAECLEYLCTTYPAICAPIELPDESFEHRTSRAIKIANGSGGDRPGVLFLGGVHAREIVNPDLLVTFALNLCRAYTLGNGLTFGNRTYDATTIRGIVDTLDLFIFPLVNPDGRAYVQAAASLGEDWLWRKNRRVNPGSPHLGVDINRNFEFLWYFGFNASREPCCDTYKGLFSFSEPETRNIKHMLDNFSNIGYMIDVHSYGKKILYPWGDDENQTTNPMQNFNNPMWNNERGQLGDDVYREYIPAADWNWLRDAGNDMRDAIAAVWGTTYTVMEGSRQYLGSGWGVSGTAKDYAFSRHMVSENRKVYAYTLETGTEFCPPPEDAPAIIAEVSAGLIQFCNASMCFVEETVRGTDLVEALDDMRAFRDTVMLRSAAGRTYNRVLQKHSSELLGLLIREANLREQALEVLRRVNGVVHSRHDPNPKVFESALIEEVNKLAESVANKGSQALQKSITALRGDLKHFVGKTAVDGLQRVSAGKATRKSVRKS